MARPIAKLLVLLPFFGHLAWADAPRPEVRPPGCSLGAASGAASEVSPFDDEEAEPAPAPDEPEAPEGAGGDEPDQSSSPAEGDEGETMQV